MRKRKIAIAFGFIACAFVLSACDETKATNTNTQIVESTPVASTTAPTITSTASENTSSVTSQQSTVSSEQTSTSQVTQNTTGAINIATVSFSNGTDNVQVKLCSGNLESIYAEFNPVTGADSYNAYVKKSTDSSYTKIDSQLIRMYKNSSAEYHYRLDAVGLEQGSYSLKIVPVVSGNEVEAKKNEINNIEVLAHDRSGYGFVEGSSSGAYNDDGTLKSDAIVVYVTPTNKDTVTAECLDKKGNKTTLTGVSNIITNMKNNTKAKPLCIRMIGNITDPANLEKGDMLVDESKNGLTIEGIGTDAVANGWGIRIKNSINVEIRNLGFMNCDSNEGDNVGLQQGNNHVWVHNCDFFYGHAGSDKDQIKGDGALDTKTSTYVTHSYNHFWDSGKSNLQGMKSESTNNYITYHHNWYDHSDSRHPRIRTCTVHIYNNYYDGNSKYGVGMTKGGSAFVENNYFRNCKYPMLTSMQGSDIYGGSDKEDAANNSTFSKEDGGVIKSYGNKFEGTYTYIPYGCTSYINKGASVAYTLGSGKTTSTVNYDAYEAQTRGEIVPSTVKSKAGSSTYSNFDTDSSMYSYLVQSPEDAKATVMEFAGRVQGGDFKWTFNNAVDDESYDVITELKSAITAYKNNLFLVQGI